MINCHVWTFSIVTSFWTLSVYQILILNVESFNLKCPVQAHWKLRAEANCTNTMKYYCLFNYIKEKYVEGCNGPDWDRTGSKRIYAGSFTRGDCTQERFQPFKFWTNGSMSDCVYSKSICSEVGQIIYIDNSRKNDRTCRCDYKRNYSFVKIPRQLCYCIPAEEDCSCYIKSCPADSTLSSDYNCISNGSQETLQCTDIMRNSETVDKNMLVDMEKDQLWLNDIFSQPRWNDTPASIVFLCLCSTTIFVIGTFFVAVLFHEWTSDKLQPLSRYIQKKYAGVVIPCKWLNKKLWKCCKVQKDDEEKSKLEEVDGKCPVPSEITPENQAQNNVSVEVEEEEEKEIITAEVHQQSKLVDLTTDEVNFLRLIHLLFRVACPVVRLTFNHEIQPNQLCRTLDKNKKKMEKICRKKEKIINNYQWNLLYGNEKGKPVTSDNFDIRLMVYILRTITNIKVGDLYPVQSDTSISALLSTIKYIRNEATQSFEGTISVERFNRYWDAIGQAVLTLVSKHIVNIKDDTEMKQLNGRLLTLNPITIDNDKLSLFIVMSEIYPATILEKLIFQYCQIKKQKMKDILTQEKHELYHKRFITDSCCKCKISFSTYTKVIPERQWENMYEIREDNTCKICPSKHKNCCESFIAKEIDTCDLSITVPLVLNIPDILLYIIDQLYKNEFDKFLLHNKHAIYHSMEQKRCCKCEKDPTEKILIIKKEWNKLFIKDDNVSCQTSLPDCCCQYTVMKEINSSNIDETLLSKICHVAGPISVLHKSGQSAFLYYLNWTIDEQPLRNALKELLNIVEDKAFKSKLEKCISVCRISKLDETITRKVDTQDWLSRHVKYEKSTPEPPLQILLSDTVKSVQIPKEFPLLGRIRHFKDFTDEEYNFLVVFHVLTKIVYPVIKNEFDTLCTVDVLDTIRKDIFEQQTTQWHNDANKDESKSHKKKVYLTQKQMDQLFSPSNEESRNLDLKLMIYILKRISEENKETGYFDQLDDIDKIRREIVQNSSGVLIDTRFQDIVNVIKKAIEHFGKEMYKKKLVNLHHIRSKRDDNCSVYKITCLTSGTYFTDKELISQGEEQISQIQNLFHQNYCDIDWKYNSVLNTDVLSCYGYDTNI